MRILDEDYYVKNFHEDLENGRIQAYFQPIYRAITEKVLCVESLARWITPEGALIAPDDFIPVLEKNDLIYELDMEVLRQVCALYRELKERGTPVYAFTINFSRYDFRHEELFDKIISTLDMYDVPHEAIKLEITESIMLHDITNSKRLFKKFSDAGFSVWLDDFGSGYSSLNMLQSYSFDVIKFDMLFIRNLSDKGREVLASLISMSKSLGIHTLTEGVETEEQKDFLVAAGCEALQGFYYSRPVSKDDLLALIDKQPDILESQEDKSYWDRIGHLNFLSPSPLIDFAERSMKGARVQERISRFDNSIALLECSQNSFHYVYASDEYKKRVRELGFDSIEKLENALSNRRSYQYLMIRKLILDAVTQGTVQTIEHVNRDVYFRLSVQYLSRREGWVMMGVRLNTFDSEREVRTAQEMLNYGSALFSTYELVVLFYPDRNVVSRLYTANDLPIYDQEGSIEGSLAKFCQAEIDPADQERYMQFLNFKTMTARIDASPKNFIQGVFRTRWESASGKWYTARVTQIPTISEKAYLLTFQNIQGDVNRWLDMFVREHPGMLESARF